MVFDRIQKGFGTIDNFIIGPCAYKLDTRVDKIGK